MHPRIQELIEHLERQRVILRDAVAQIPVELESRRPAPDRWSAAEIVEHLGIVEARIASLLAKQLEDARAAGLRGDPETSSVLSARDLERLADRSRRVVAGETSQPKGEMTMAAGWAVLEDARRTLLDVILSADGLDLSEVHAPHRTLGTLNMYQWVVFVGAHEARHAAQIREVAGSL